MSAKPIVGIIAAAILAATAVSLVRAGAPPKRSEGDYEPMLKRADFVGKIDNAYFPLPVGRTLIYKGTKDGQPLLDTVRVTNRTTVLEGITARGVSDISRSHGKVIEKTTDWYAQDKQGNVWYLGENTEEFNPDGTVDTSGSWHSGVNDGEPGIIMEADPQIPDAYRQEYLAGQAEDTAWIVNQGGSVTVPYGTVNRVLTSLEFARIEPNVIDKKVYAPGLGIVMERAMTGPLEVSRLVRVRN